MYEEGFQWETWLSVWLIAVRPKKIPMFLQTRPTLLFRADPAIFIAILKIIKRFIHLPTLPLHDNS